MKSYKLLKTVVMTVLVTILGHSAQALDRAPAAREGGVVTGGGSYVIIDGQTKIADPYYAGVPARQMKKLTRGGFKDLPQLVQEYIQQVYTFTRIMNLDMGTFFELNVYAMNKFIFVPRGREQNVPCDHYLPELVLSVDKHYQYGCTFEEDTYLFIDKWQQAPVAEQAFAILHERWWAAHPGADQADVAKFNSLLEQLEFRYRVQLGNRDRKEFTAKEKQSLMEFYHLANRYGFLRIQYGQQRPLQQNIFEKGKAEIVSGGGFLIGDCREKIKVGRGAFIGLGSWIQSYCSGGTLDISDTVFIGSKASVFSEQDRHFTNGTITNSGLTNTDVDRSSIRDSTVYGAQFIESSIEKSVVGNGLYIRSKIINSNIANKEDNNSYTGWMQAESVQLEKVDIPGNSIISYADLKNTTIHDPRWQSNKATQLNFTELRGESTSRILLNNVALDVAKIEMLPGSSLEDFKTPDQWQLQIKVGQSSGLKSVKILSSPYPALRTLVIEASTHVSNGTFTLNSLCGGNDDPMGGLPAPNKFYLGDPAIPSARDNRNFKVDLANGNRGCIIRY